jgi:hypothetical protein
MGNRFDRLVQAVIHYIGPDHGRAFYSALTRQITREDFSKEAFPVNQDYVSDKFYCTHLLMYCSIQVRKLLNEKFHLREARTKCKPLGTDRYSAFQKRDHSVV